MAGYVILRVKELGDLAPPPLLRDSFGLAYALAPIDELTSASNEIVIWKPALKSYTAEGSKKLGELMVPNALAAKCIRAGREANMPLAISPVKMMRNRFPFGKEIGKLPLLAELKGKNTNPAVDNPWYVKDSILVSPNLVFQEIFEPGAGNIPANTIPSNIVRKDQYMLRAANMRRTPMFNPYIERKDYSVLGDFIQNALLVYASWTMLNGIKELEEAYVQLGTKIDEYNAWQQEQYAILKQQTWEQWQLDKQGVLADYQQEYINHLNSTYYGSMMPWSTSGYTMNPTGLPGGTEIEQLFSRLTHTIDVGYASMFGSIPVSMIKFYANGAALDAYASSIGATSLNPSNAAWAMPQYFPPPPPEDLAQPQMPNFAIAKGGIMAYMGYKLCMFAVANAASIYSGITNVNRGTSNIGRLESTGYKVKESSRALTVASGMGYNATHMQTTLQGYEIHSFIKTAWAGMKSICSVIYKAFSDSEDGPLADLTTSGDWKVFDVAWELEEYDKLYECHMENATLVPKVKSEKNSHGEIMAGTEKWYSDGQRVEIYPPKLKGKNKKKYQGGTPRMAKALLITDHSGGPKSGRPVGLQWLSAKDQGHGFMPVTFQRTKAQLSSVLPSDLRGPKIIDKPTDGSYAKLKDEGNIGFILPIVGAANPAGGGKGAVGYARITNDRHVLMMQFQRFIAGNVFESAKATRDAYAKFVQLGKTKFGGMELGGKSSTFKPINPQWKKEGHYKYIRIIEFWRNRMDHEVYRMAQCLTDVFQIRHVNEIQVGTAPGLRTYGTTNVTTAARPGRAGQKTPKVADSYTWAGVGGDKLRAYLEPIIDKYGNLADVDVVWPGQGYQMEPNRKEVTIGEKKYFSLELSTAKLQGGGGYNDHGPLTSWPANENLLTSHPALQLIVSKKTGRVLECRGGYLKPILKAGVHGGDAIRLDASKSYRSVQGSAENGGDANYYYPRGKQNCSPSCKLAPFDDAYWIGDLKDAHGSNFDPRHYLCRPYIVCQPPKDSEPKRSVKLTNINRLGTSITEFNSPLSGGGLKANGTPQSRQPFPDISVDSGLVPQTVMGTATGLSADPEWQSSAKMLVDAKWENIYQGWIALWGYMSDMTEDQAYFTYLEKRQKKVDFDISKSTPNWNQNLYSSNMGRFPMVDKKSKHMAEWTDFLGVKHSAKSKVYYGYPKQFRLDIVKAVEYANRGGPVTYPEPGGPPTDARNKLNWSASQDEWDAVRTFSSFQPTFGKCDSTSINALGVSISRRAFANPSAYGVFTTGPKINEGLCSKKSCGALHLYTNVPPLGLALDEPSGGYHKNNEALDVCGNVEITVALFPTANSKILGLFSKRVGWGQDVRFWKWGGMETNVSRTNTPSLWYGTYITATGMRDDESNDNYYGTHYYTVRDYADKGWLSKLTESILPSALDVSNANIMLPEIWGNWSDTFSYGDSGWKKAGRWVLEVPGLGGATRGLGFGISVLGSILGIESLRNIQDTFSTKPDFQLYALRSDLARQKTWQTHLADPGKQANVQELKIAYERYAMVKQGWGPYYAEIAGETGSAVCKRGWGTTDKLELEVTRTYHNRHICKIIQGFWNDLHSALPEGLNDNQAQEAAGINTAGASIDAIRTNIHPARHNLIESKKSNFVIGHGASASVQHVTAPISQWPLDSNQGLDMTQGFNKKNNMRYKKRMLSGLCFPKVKSSGLYWRPTMFAASGKMTNEYQPWGQNTAGHAPIAIDAFSTDEATREAVGAPNLPFGEPEDFPGLAKTEYIYHQVLTSRPIAGAPGMFSDWARAHKHEHTKGDLSHYTEIDAKNKVGAADFAFSDPGFSHRNKEEFSTYFETFAASSKETTHEFDHHLYVLDKTLIAHGGNVSQTAKDGLAVKMLEAFKEHKIKTVEKSQMAPGVVQGFLDAGREIYPSTSDNNQGNWQFEANGKLIPYHSAKKEVGLVAVRSPEQTMKGRGDWNKLANEVDLQLKTWGEMMPRVYVDDMGYTDWVYASGVALCATMKEDGTVNIPFTIAAGGGAVTAGNPRSKGYMNIIDERNDLGDPGYGRPTFRDLYLKWNQPANYIVDRHNKHGVQFSVRQQFGELSDDAGFEWAYDGPRTYAEQMWQQKDLQDIHPYPNTWEIAYEEWAFHKYDSASKRWKFTHTAHQNNEDIFQGKANFGRWRKSELDELQWLIRGRGCNKEDAFNDASGQHKMYTELINKFHFTGTGSYYYDTSYMNLDSFFGISDTHLHGLDEHEIAARRLVSGIGHGCTSNEAQQNAIKAMKFMAEHRLTGRCPDLGWHENPSDMTKEDFYDKYCLTELAYGGTGFHGPAGYLQTFRFPDDAPMNDMIKERTIRLDCGDFGDDYCHQYKLGSDNTFADCDVVGSVSAFFTNCCPWGLTRPQSQMQAWHYCHGDPTLPDGCDVFGTFGFDPNGFAEGSYTGPTFSGPNDNGCIEPCVAKWELMRIYGLECKHTEHTNALEAWSTSATAPEDPLAAIDIQSWNAGGIYDIKSNANPEGGVIQVPDWNNELRNSNESWVSPIPDGRQAAIDKLAAELPKWSGDWPRNSTHDKPSNQSYPTKLKGGFSNCFTEFTGTLPWDTNASASNGNLTFDWAAMKTGQARPAGWKMGDPEPGGESNPYWHRGANFGMFKDQVHGTGCSWEVKLSEAAEILGFDETVDLWNPNTNAMGPISPCNYICKTVDATPNDLGEVTDEALTLAEGQAKAAVYEEWKTFYRSDWYDENMLGIAGTPGATAPAGSTASNIGSQLIDECRFEHGRQNDTHYGQNGNTPQICSTGVHRVKQYTDLGTKSFGFQHYSLQPGIDGIGHDEIESLVALQQNLEMQRAGAVIAFDYAINNSWVDGLGMNPGGLRLNDALFGDSSQNIDITYKVCTAQQSTDGEGHRLISKVPDTSFYNEDGLLGGADTRALAEHDKMDPSVMINWGYGNAPDGGTSTQGSQLGACGAWAYRCNSDYTANGVAGGFNGTNLYPAIGRVLKTQDNPHQSFTVGDFEYDFYEIVYSGAKPADENGVIKYQLQSASYWMTATPIGGSTQGAHVTYCVPVDCDNWIAVLTGVEPTFKDTIKEVVITGHVSGVRKDWNYEVGVARNYYSGQMFASGFLPYVSGVSDWTNSGVMAYEHGEKQLHSSFEQNYMLDLGKDRVVDVRTTSSQPISRVLSRSKQRLQGLDGDPIITANLGAIVGFSTVEQQHVRVAWDIPREHEMIKNIKDGTMAMPEGRADPIVEKSDPTKTYGQKGDNFFMGGFPLVNPAWPAEIGLGAHGRHMGAGKFIGKRIIVFHNWGGTNVGTVSQKELQDGITYSNKIIPKTNRKKIEDEKVHVATPGFMKNYEFKTPPTRGGRGFANNRGRLYKKVYDSQNENLRDEPGRGQGMIAAVCYTEDAFNKLVREVNMTINVSNQNFGHIDGQHKKSENPKYYAKFKDDYIPVMFYEYEGSLAACEHCLPQSVMPAGTHERGDDTTPLNTMRGLAQGRTQTPDGPNQAVQFGEQFIIGMRHRWDIRSGNWEFDIPYTQENTTVMYRGPRGEAPRALEIKPWTNYVWPRKEEFDKYDPRLARTGYHIAPNTKNWPFPPGLSCESYSKFDRVVDLSIEGQRRWVEIPRGGTIEILNAGIQHPVYVGKPDLKHNYGSDGVENLYALGKPGPAAFGYYPAGSTVLKDGYYNYDHPSYMTQIPEDVVTNGADGLVGVAGGVNRPRGGVNTTVEGLTAGKDPNAPEGTSPVEMKYGQTWRTNELRFYNGFLSPGGPYCAAYTPTSAGDQSAYPGSSSLNDSACFVSFNKSANWGDDSSHGSFCRNLFTDTWNFHSDGDSCSRYK